LFGDLTGGARLLDDQIVVVSLDDSFELRVFVAGADEKESSLLANALVRLGIDRELVGAFGVGALADVDRLCVGLAIPLFEPSDVLVDFAEERLVAGGSLLPQ
jgi:hypothetical protein